MNGSFGRVLVVDDEEHLALGIAENLEAEGYAVQVAFDGGQALSKLAESEVDLVVLDVMMPVLDGLAVCKRLRDAGNQVPILFLTARSALDDRIRGLEAGGDDYLAKPFALEELLLRVAAIVRRKRWYDPESRPAEDVVEFDGNRVDFRTYIGHSRDGREEALTHKEAMILKFLVEREGEIASREEILERVWGYDVYPSTRTIDNFIVRLRKRFERDPEQPRHFHTVRGVGYRFTRTAEQ
ncbi:MAG: response regulator transcription factor [Planctomycetes bacterium]|nr:response regulator transcription factor [Planctomycetota bacterium]MCB9903788.1 response regulator transcription factor [Planctomycetota bacterium]